MQLCERYLLLQRRLNEAARSACGDCAIALNTSPSSRKCWEDVQGLTLQSWDLGFRILVFVWGGIWGGQAGPQSTGAVRALVPLLAAALQDGQS